MVSIRRLTWDNWNIAHIARHEVTPGEVEEVCHGPFVSLQSYQNRLLVIGPTQAQRMLTVVLDPEGEGSYYPITARPAHRKERRYYQEMTGGENK